MDSLVQFLFQHGGIVQIAVVLVPGFIAWRTYQLLRPHGAQKPADAFVEILTFSVFTRLIWFSGNWTAWPDTLLKALVFGLQVVVTPFVIALAYFWFIEFCARRYWIPSPHPRAWDFIFNGLAYRKKGVGSRGLFLVVTLNDGTKVGGVYSDPGFASLWPYDRDVLLGKAWVLEDGKPVREVDGSIGLYVSASNVQTLEVIDYAVVVQSAIEAAQGEE